MSKRKHGPWQVAMLDRPHLRPYYVVRQTGNTHWDHLLDADGRIARFETDSDARTAIAKATGAQQ